MPQELVEDTIGFIVSDNTSLSGYKSIALDFYDLRERIEPINEELMSKLFNKSTDVNQLTITGMHFCSPEFVSQLKKYAATVFHDKSFLTENRLTRYETALEDNDDD